MPYVGVSIYDANLEYSPTRHIYCLQANEATGNSMSAVLYLETMIDIKCNNVDAQFYLYYGKC